MSSPGNSRGPFYLILILLLLLVNGWIFYNNYKLKKEKVAIETEKSSLEDEKNQLQIEYNETISELDLLQTENEELNEEQVQLREELETQKANIEEILQNKDMSKAELSKARRMISSLQGKIENYTQQISQLQKANTELADANTQLKQEVVVQQAVTKGLEEEKDSLSNQYQDELSKMSEAKDQLEDKVAKAQQLFPDRIYANGIKFKKNNKQTYTDNAKRTDQIEVCFDLMPNPSIENPSQEIMLRIINPEGVTLALGSSGSGKLTLSETGKEVQYSTKKQIKYKPTKKEKHCVYWQQDQEYTEGVYNAEIYHSGRMIGSTTFELKNKIF